MLVQLNAYLEEPVKAERGEFLTKYITFELDTNKLTTKNPIWKSQCNKLTVKTLQVSNLRYINFPLYI